MMDRQYMSDWQRYEQTGEWPDAVFVPEEDFDRFDPEQVEIASMVIEYYEVENRNRRERRLQNQVAALRQILEENDIEVPDDL